MTQHVEPYPGALADQRRALALLSHYINGDIEGVREIVTESNKIGHDGWLLFAVMDIAIFVAPVLQNQKLATEMLSQAASNIAAMEAINNATNEATNNEANDE